jgi:hypothetical protein
MPRGSGPGERRGGRQRGTPNKKTALIDAAITSAAANPNMTPLDFLLGVMRAPNVPADLRIKVAQAAAPFVHSKPASSPPSDPALSAKLIDAAGNVAIEPAAARDPLLDAIEALRREERDAQARRCGG